MDTAIQARPLKRRKFAKNYLGDVVLIFSALETSTDARFALYDPNNQRDSTELVYLGLG